MLFGPGVAGLWLNTDESRGEDKLLLVLDVLGVMMLCLCNARPESLVVKYIDKTFNNLSWIVSRNDGMLCAMSLSVSIKI